MDIKSKDRMALELLNLIIRTCELHGVDFMKLSEKTRHTLYDICRAGIVYGAMKMKDVYEEGGDNL